VIFGTGGTTGPPKAVMWDTRSLATTYEVYRHYYPAHPQPVWLVATPVFYRGQTLAMFATGATIVLKMRFIPDEIGAAIARHKVTHMALAPTALYSLLECPEAVGVDYSSLVMISSGMAPVSNAALARAVRQFGPCICQVYAQIECGIIAWADAATIADAVAGEKPDRLKSCGRVAYATVVTIVDNDGREQPLGSVGQIAVRGRTVRLYLLPPPGTRQNPSAAWHRTGDFGYMDADG
jgi:acyl-CoA synthetase (AMP-forming)/AMP-acid ligase II